MIIYFLLLPLVSSFHIDVEHILLQTECTIPIVSSTHGVTWDKPFLLRNENHTNDILKNEMSIHNLIHKYGNTTIGIDFPGPAPPPTDAWRSINLDEYINKYVLHNKSYEEYLGSEVAICWAATDICEFTGTCRNKSQNMVPMNVSDTFDCYGMDEPVRKVFGVAGKYGGLPFHHHTLVYNQLLYGKKIWYFIDNKYDIDFVNSTSAHYVYDLLTKGIPIPYDTCIQEAGDFIYVPDYHWHMTFNFETVFMAGCAYD